MTQAELRFDGRTYDADRDQHRLSHEYKAVWLIMLDGGWHTLPELADRTGYGENGCSARLRDFRKERNGAHTVLRRYVEHGLFEYRLIVNDNRPSSASTAANGLPEGTAEGR